MSARRSADDGFSMVEVLVAIVIIGIVASSALWFFINGMQTSSNLNRQQTAVTIANSAMEQAFVIEPRTDVGAGVSGLVIGRPAANVQAAFTALGPTATGSLKLNKGAGIDGVTLTYPLSDPAGGTPTLPIKTTVDRGGVDYDVYTLVGSCYRVASPSDTSPSCEKVAGYSAEPASEPSGKTRLLRIIVVVTWLPIGGECDGMCHYDVATLVDPSTDLVWNNVVEPEAVADSVEFLPGGAAKTLDLLGNDVLGSVPNYPVKILTAPPAGTGTVGTPQPDGTVTYTPPAMSAWVSGIFSFTYQIHDTPGKTSQADVLVYLKPGSANDSYNAYQGVSQVLPVFANDPGSPDKVNIVSGPSLGGLTKSGTTLTYNPTTLGNDVFTYTYTDAAGQESPMATVTINVQAVSATDITKVVPYRPSATATWVDISADLRGPGGGPASITVTGPPPAGQLRIDNVIYTSGTKTGTKVEFQPPSTTVGEWTFPFSLTLGSYSTAVKNATMRVLVVAANDGSYTITKSTSKTPQVATLSVGTNDTPKLWGSGGVTQVQQGAISSGCGAWTTGSASPSPTDITNGQLRITAPTSTINNCTATYTLTTSGSTSTATISYRVTN